jgi:acyl-CoA synthetase (AMP-forming)/AMP-acid ligase II
MPDTSIIILEPKSIWDDPTIRRTASDQEVFSEVKIDSLRQGEVVFFTSGTTGLSKGVLITWQALVGNATAIATALQFGEERHLMVLSPAHTNGQVISLLAPLISGGSVVIGTHVGFSALFQFWNDVRRLRVNVVDCVPTVIASLLRLSGSVVQNAHRPRLIITGGAPIAPTLIDQFENEFGLQLLQEYGLSEAVCVSSCERPGVRRIGSVGKPLPGTEVRILHDDNSSCSVGCIGRVAIATKCHMLGYLQDAGHLGFEPVDDTILTEDLGYLDVDGFLFILGRRDDTIIKGGYNILPADVESALLELAGVQSSVAFGVMCDVYGQDLVLAVRPVSNFGLTKAEVSSHLKARGGPMWNPRQVIFLDEIPTTISGKPLRRVLRAKYLAGDL